MRHCGVPVVAHVRSPDAAKNLGSLAKKFCTGINPNPSDACGWVPPSQSTRLHALTRRSLPSRVRVPRPRVGACGVERTGRDAVPRGLSRSAAARRGRGVSVGRGRTGRGLAPTSRTTARQRARAAKAPRLVRLFGGPFVAAADFGRVAGRSLWRPGQQMIREAASRHSHGPGPRMQWWAFVRAWKEIVPGPIPPK